MIGGDKISEIMGAPPNHWIASERQQMANIHKCYKVAYSGHHDQRVDFESVVSEEEEFVTNKGNKVKVTGEDRHVAGEELRDDEQAQEDMRAAGAVRDEEKFLPADSPLRSKDASKKAPANVPFKDFDTFINSCSFDHWKHYFDRSTGDKVLVETARGLISKICTVQARNELRSKNGYVPFRKKREHITPLALTLHELKQWCVSFLRTADPMHEDSFREVKNRIVFIEGLSHKEVWGASVGKIAQGIRTKAQDKLFRLLVSAKQELERAEEYCYRAYSRRTSREKLKHIENSLKELLLNEMRILSGRCEIDRELNDPKTSRLQPLDLLNAIENMQYVDFKNPVNVMLFSVFKNPFVKACFTGDYESAEVLDAIANLDKWNEENQFCKIGDGAPVMLVEKRKDRRVVPEIYAGVASEIKTLVRKIDSKTPVPDNVKKLLAKSKVAYESEKVADEIMTGTIKALAALQEVIPSLYVIYKLWSLAGEGGDYTIYDNMREHVIRVMQDIIDRIQVMKSASGALRKIVHKHCEKKEEQIKLTNMKKGKMVYKPNWVRNHRFIATEMQRVSSKSYSMSIKKLMEVAEDAKEYSLTADQLSDKVAEAKKIFDMLTGHKEEVYEVPQEETEQVPINTKKADKDKYIQNKAPVADDSDDDEGYEFGANGNFESRNKLTTSKLGVFEYDSDDSY